MSMHASLDELRDLLDRHGLLNHDTPWPQRLAQALQLDRVRQILDLQLPPVTDLTSLLGVKQGRIRAIRWDLLPGVDNHKKPVVACLILRNVLLGRLPREGVNTLIDAGNFNSAKAVKFYARRFGMNGTYIMSRLFPPDIIALLESDDFQIIRAPHLYDCAREREFYEYLVEQMRIRAFRRNKVCLWHAKHGGVTTYPLGVEIAAQLAEAPDVVVSCLGAGSTLTGLQLAIQDRFHGNKPRVIVAEHEWSALLANSIPIIATAPLPDRFGVAQLEYRSHPAVPHFVIGPHYDEINPLIRATAIARIGGIVQYGEEWQQVQEFLRTNGVSAGNSSAANISTAIRLAEEGNDVLTVIFEPCRQFYQVPEPFIATPPHWLEQRWQQWVAAAAVIAWLTTGALCALYSHPDAPWPTIG